MEKSLEKLQETFENSQAWESLVDNFINESTEANTPDSDILSTQEFRFELERKMQSVISMFIKKHIKELLGCKTVVDSQENSIENLNLEIASLREENEQLNEMSLSLVKEIKRLKKYVNESDVLISVLRGEMCKQRYQNKLFVNALKQIYEGNEDTATEILTKAFSLYQDSSENAEDIYLTSSGPEARQKSLENSFIHSETPEEERVCQSAKLKSMLAEINFEESQSSVNEGDEYIQQLKLPIAEENTDIGCSHIEESKPLFERTDKVDPGPHVILKQDEIREKEFQSEKPSNNIQIEKKSPEVKKRTLSKWLMPVKKVSTLSFIKSHDEIETRTTIIDMVEDKVDIFVEKLKKEAKSNTDLPFEAIIKMPLAGIRGLLQGFFGKN